MMPYGHVHGMHLERRDGGMFLTIAYIDILQEECERQRSLGTASLAVVLLRTPIAATTRVVEAFNQGDASYLRSDDQARTIRLALFDFMQASASDDIRWGIVADDLRRHATKLLCIADNL